MLLGFAAGAEEVPTPGPVATSSEIATSDATAPAEEESAGEVPELTARGRYNLGLAHVGDGSYEEAAAEFLAARDNAGPDPELRYRAAFNLGLALAAQAGFGDPAPESVLDQTPEDPAQEPTPAPEQAIETLRQSAAWFNDAVRLAPPGDDDARINLELVSKWILQLADQLNEGDKLEARLDRLIDDQRGIRDQLRGLLAEVADAGAGAEPVGFATDFEALAVRERTLMAEVSDCVDLASEERLYIEQTPEEERSPDQQARAYQLGALTDYLERARQSFGDARRRLRRLEGERAHRRVDAALRELKRAREQLWDPVRVLQATARDERQLIAHTRALAAFDDASIQLGETLPGWLTAKHLVDRQEDIGARAGGILGRFEAVAATDPAVLQESAKPGSERVLDAAVEAVPILDDGLAAMRDAVSALESGDAASAVGEEDRALAALTETIELFADVKTLIELAYSGQQGVVRLLSPDDDANAPELDPDDRARVITELVDDNSRRLARLESLLEEEGEAAVSAIDEQGADADDGASARQDGASARQDGAFARQAAEQRYQLAEEVRRRAAEGLAELADHVDRGSAGAARTQAAETLTDLEELRRLFFSIVEHLAALLADQGDTHDATATLQVESSAELGDAFAPSVASAAQRQTGHSQLADQLAAALARQADAQARQGDTQGSPSTGAGAPVPPGDPGAGERLAKAADEVRKGAGRMTSAATLLADAAERATTMSPELEPALADQQAAMEHLENALRELVPPQQPQQQGEEQQQGDQAQPQPQPGEDEQMSQRQALKRLQAIRDREAERQRDRGERNPREPVEKDW